MDGGQHNEPPDMLAEQGSRDQGSGRQRPTTEDPRGTVMFDFDNLPQALSDYDAHRKAQEQIVGDDSAVRLKLKRLDPTFFLKDFTAFASTSQGLKLCGQYSIAKTVVVQLQQVHS